MTTATSDPGSQDLLLMYLHAQIDELRARDPGVRIDSPDAVHRMRVASRRLRSSLATFGPLFTGSQARHLRRELQWLGAVLGSVRDVEVIRAHLQGTASKVTADADLTEVLSRLDAELAARHSRAHRKLVSAMNRARYAALLGALDDFVTSPPWAEKATARHTVAALVGRACERVDRAARVAEGSLDLDGDELHDVRKAAKRARYAAEVAVPSVGFEARTLAKSMEELQEVLGAHQDSLLARGLLQELARRMSEQQAYALGLLAGMEHASDESVLAAYGLALTAASADEVRDWTR
jgi:CHAD domain-containing protein